MNPQDHQDMNDAWADELQLYAPLTIEMAPENFVAQVMARIDEVDNLTVIPEPPLSAPRRTGGRIRRIIPIAATAAAVMLLFAMPALRRDKVTGLADAGSSAPLESAPAPKIAAPQAEGEEKVETITSFDAGSTETPPEEGDILPQESEIQNAPPAGELQLPFKSALSRGCGGLIDTDDGEDYCLLYGATGRPAGIAFCVILEGGTPPEDILPAVPGQYLISAEQLEALLLEQPEGVEPVYVEEGLTPTATVGLVIIKQPTDD